jgi:hypothetical protein
MRGLHVSKPIVSRVATIATRLQLLKEYLAIRYAPGLNSKGEMNEDIYSGRVLEQQPMQFSANRPGPLLDRLDIQLPARLHRGV